MLHISHHPPRNKTSPRRDTPVVCPRCGRSVTRKARQQVYCSTHCRERDKKRFYGLAPLDPPKNVNGFKSLPTPKIGSGKAPLRAPRKVIAIEVFGGRNWSSIVSPHGIACEVGTLRKRTLCDGGAK